MDNLLPRIYEGALIFLLIFSSVFCGTLNPVPAYVLKLFLLILFSFFIIDLSRKHEPVIVYPRGTLAILFFLLIVLLQCLPLPLPIIKIISPQTAYLFENFLPNEFSTSPHALSIYPAITKEGLIQFISYLSIFFLTINTIKTRKQFERIFLFIIAWAVVLNLYGAIKRYFFNAESAFGLSTFGNQNHFAGYMVLITPLAAGYAIYCKNFYKKLFFSFLCAMLAAGIFFSLSRAALLSLICSFFLMTGVFFLAKKTKWRRNVKTVFLIIIIIIVLLTAISLESMRQKLSITHRGLNERIIRFKDALDLAKNFLFFGVGLGNFRYIFTRYRTFFSDQLQFYLHNDHLQLLVEVGLAGLISYCLFFFYVLRSIVNQLFSRRDPLVKNMLLGGICGIFALLLDSFFDLDFHIPAIAFMFWFLLGLLYKFSYTHFRSNTPNKSESQ
ncbi:MAG: O-antigen ligase family protein [Candidatus Omnitrophica bacterium]|nr:O-antigen ligase family protein [Candidatus Omnitrophota bacterium]